MNELIFLCHIGAVSALIFLAARLGKEALIALFALMVVTANLFVIKQVSLFGLDVTCTDVFIIGSMIALQLIQEYFGKDLAKKTIWIGFFGLLFFGVMSLFHLGYDPILADQTHSSYAIILKQNPRILAASFITFIIVQRLDIFIFGALKKRLPNAPLFARSALTLVPTQLIDTILFSYLGLYGLVISIPSIILVSTLIKILIMLTMSPMTLFTKRLVKTL